MTFMAEPTLNPMDAEDKNGGGIDGAEETRGPVKLDPSRWVERYGDSLWRYAMAKARDAQAAEDLVQDTLVTALGAAARFEGRSAELTWLTGILKHKLMEHYRRTKRQPEQLDGDNPDSRFDASGHWSQLPGRITAEGAGDGGQDELLGRLGVCREQLPPTLLEPLELREVQGLSGEAICAALELSSSALWTRLHRAREALRNCLEKSAKAASEAFAAGRGGKGKNDTISRTGGASETAS
jgi:RNA polymerase sigma-70 factor (ECF subfamily)